MSSSRQLAAIMFTDIVGYTALMAQDETEALGLLRINRNLHKRFIHQYKGKLLKEMGDGILASFPTITDAVYCAATIQKEGTQIDGLNLRIGIHQGEVLIEGDENYGDGVNIASRIEGIAESGQILVSEVVYKNIRNKKGIEIRLIGKKQLKNIYELLKIYEVIYDQWQSPSSSMTFKDRLNQPFPFFLNDDRKNFLLIVGVSLFVTFFVGVFSPFQESYSWEFIAAYGAICFLVMSFDIFLLPKLFPVWFDSGNWNLSKYLQFNFFLLFSVGTAITLVNIGLRGWENSQPVALLWLVDQLHVALVGLFPMVLIIMIVKDGIIQVNQKEGKEATEKLNAVHQVSHEIKQPIITIQADTQEHLKLSPDDFLLAEANDNYSLLYWRTGSEVSKKLLRITLKNLESQITNESIIRCHRSYIINLRAAIGVTGNATGYKLTLENFKNEIPVSRSLGKEVMERIRRL